MKSLKTPLRYPGGKSRAITKMAQFLPDMGKYKEYREPFLGGGSVALYMTKTFPHLEIWVNDLYEPLVNFWQQLQDDGDEIAKDLRALKERHDSTDRARYLFLECKENLDKEATPRDRAVYFYVINKCSFSGLTESSSFSAQASQSNFSIRGIDKLPGYQELIEDWTITNLTYERMLSDEKDSFIYLDPPYEIGSHLYGKKGDLHKYFSHRDFAERCDRFNHDAMVSYNSSQLIKDRFKDWKAIEYEHTYTMRSTSSYTRAQRGRKELVLLNYD